MTLAQFHLDEPQVLGDEASPSIAGFSALEAKLHPPAVADDLVLRGELIDRLRESSSYTTVLLSAPAGYGKSTVLRQWAQEDERPFAWLTLDECDDDPSALLNYLLAALASLDTSDATLRDAVQQVSGADPDAALARVGRALWQWGTPFVLVLDRVDCLKSPESLRVLSALTLHLAENCQVAMAARQVPGLPWEQLRGGGRALQFGIEDLQLTHAEGTAVLEAAGLDLEAMDMDALLERAEGWAAGLNLAALSLRDLDDCRKAAESFSGDDHLVARYLRDELFARLPDVEQVFMTRASIVERMCGPLCDWLVERHDSGALLREMERANHFVIRLDRQDTWYRFHRLFMDMLRSELVRREPAMVKPLHSRASTWLEEAGDLDAAIRHAQAGGDVPRAARLIWSEAAARLGSGQLRTLQIWIDSFTDDQVVAHANLALAAAWCAVTEGHAAEHWISAAERGLYDADVVGETDSIASATTLLRAMLSARGVLRMGEDARLASTLQAPDDPWRCVAMYLRAVSFDLTGRTEEATALLEETERLAAVLGMPAVRAAALGQLAVVAIDDSRWEEADELGNLARGVAQDAGVEDLPGMAMLDCVSAILLAKQGNADTARRLARRAMRGMALIAHLPAWRGVQGHCLLGRTYLLLNDTEAARNALSEAQKYLTAADDASALRERLDHAWRSVEKTPLAWGSGPYTLTSAELRVLQYLPTHLSFEQIGKRLFVSRNTVKTQAIAAYRKLGVTSRADAVERAQGFGLLPAG